MLLSRREEMLIRDLLWRSLLVEADGSMDPAVLLRAASKRLDLARQEQEPHTLTPFERGYQDAFDHLDADPGAHALRVEPDITAYMAGYDVGMLDRQDARAEEFARDHQIGLCSATGHYY